MRVARAMLPERDDHADAELRHVAAGAARSKAVLEFAAEREDRIGEAQRGAAVVGQLELATGLAEQRPAERRLEQVDLTAQRLRRQVQLARRDTERAESRDTPEVMEVTEVHQGDHFEKTERSVEKFEFTP